MTPAGVWFRVWAPGGHRVAVELDSDIEFALSRTADGCWEALVPTARAGTRYRYRVNDWGAFPDPYSRSQPDGVHGPSEVVDPATFTWHDATWPGLRLEGLVVYQLHVGTATAAGTFDSLIEMLPRLAALGCTAIEPLPVAEFPGRRNWGYDGVDLFAPSSVYGGPEALRRLVDAAHQAGLGVILDVVYNHLGPDGNYLRAFAEDYFTDRYHTPWGEAVNFDGPRSQWVRRLVVDNASRWITEFHVDGLRLDATHAIYDRSPTHILAELTTAAREVAGPRSMVLIAETHENDVRYLQPTTAGGYGLDAVWADDFHHAVRRYLAGDHEGYYADYTGLLSDVATCIRDAWLYTGQPTPSSGSQVRRGTPAGDVAPAHFVYVLQNHDQVGNRPFGDRLTDQVDLARYRVASTLLLFLPYTPMLFMGQEFAATSPFEYFTDHNPELGRLVTEGRRREFAAFSAFADPATRERIPDPQAESTFVASRLSLADAATPTGEALQSLYHDLLALRRTDPVLRVQSRHDLDARTVGDDVLLVRRWTTTGERLLVANFGEAPVQLAELGRDWTIQLAVNEASRVTADGPRVPGRAAAIFARGTDV